MKCSEPCFIKKYLAELCEFTNLTIIVVMRPAQQGMIPRNQFPSFQPYVTTEIMIIIQKYPVHYIQLWIIIVIITTEVIIIITIQLWIQKPPQKNRPFFDSPFPVDFPFAKWSNSKTLSCGKTLFLLGDPQVKTLAGWWIIDYIMIVHH